MQLFSFCAGSYYAGVLNSIQLWSDVHETAPQSFDFISNRKQTEGYRDVFQRNSLSLFSSPFRVLVTSPLFYAIRYYKDYLKKEKVAKCVEAECIASY